MRYLSVCSGIEAATVAWEPLGWMPVAFSEIEAFPAAVLAHHYPNVPNLGDMTKIDGAQWRGKVDVLVGGTPCQAFSVAGLRGGLADRRGNLTLTFLELANAIEPAFTVWENVPGVLSDKTNAFGCLLGGLVGANDALQNVGGWPDRGMVRGPKRIAAWRVLDAQWFGLAQRRARVFLVACPRNGADPGEVLFEREGVQRHSAPSREAGKGVAADVAPCIGASGRGFERGGDTRGQDPVVAFLHTNKGRPAGRQSKHTEMVSVKPLVETLTTDGHARSAVCITGEVAHSLRAEGFDASEDGTGRGQPMVACFGGNNTSGPIDVAAARNASGSAGGRLDFESETFAVSVALRGREGGGACEMGDDKAYALRCGGGGGDKPHVLAFHENQRAEVTLNDTVGSLKVGGGKPGQGYPAVCFKTDQEPESHGDLCPTLQQPSPSGGGQPHAVMQHMRVRRLTPRECERLQGFPDDYTLIPWRGKPAEVCPDGPRYKALGNSMAVPCMRWIGRRIEALFRTSARHASAASAGNMLTPAEAVQQLSFFKFGQGAVASASM